MIEKIILKVGEKTIELTDDEARQVWADLNPKFNQTTYIPIYPTYPFWYSYPSTCETKTYTYQPAETTIDYFESLCKRPELPTMTFNNDPSPR